MAATKTNPRVIFLHIPKTAGSSLNRFLVKNTRHLHHFDTMAGSVITPKRWQMILDKILTEPEEERDERMIVKGHMYFGLHRYFNGPTEYVTFLREPGERVSSHFRMMRRHADISPDTTLDPSKPDWNLGPKDINFRLSLDNGQVRALSGADLDLPLGGVTEEHLRQAQANLKAHFRFVGVMREYDFSQLILGRLYGWNWKFYVPKNVAPKSDQYRIPPDVMAAIRELNRFDQELYRTAEEEFERLVREYGVSLRIERWFFRFFNSIHMRLHHLRRNLKEALGLKRPSAEEDESPAHVS